MRLPFIAGINDHDRRLESVLRRLLPNQSLGALHKALRQGDIRLNGLKASSDSRVSTGDEIAVWEALIPTVDSPKSTVVPSAELPPEWILFEGIDFLVINKPSGLLVHRGEERDPNPQKQPLDNLVRSWLAQSASNSLSFRPGPLHRLDRQTSGLVVFSKTLVGARSFSLALAERMVKKTYLTVVSGLLNGSRDITAPLIRDESARMTRTIPSAESKAEEAHSLFVPLAQAKGMTLVEVDLGTGRTHQIRAHAKALGLSLAGDQKYGGGSRPPGLDVDWLLHAWKLNCELMPSLEAPLPPFRAQWVEKTFKIHL